MAKGALGEWLLKLEPAIMDSNPRRVISAPVCAKTINLPAMFFPLLRMVITIMYTKDMMLSKDKSRVVKNIGLVSPDKVKADRTRIVSGINSIKSKILLIKCIFINLVILAPLELWCCIVSQRTVELGLSLLFEFQF